MSAKRAKFRVGQVVRVLGPNYASVDRVWWKKMPAGYADGAPLYQLHANTFLLEQGTLMFREFDLTGLTRREKGD